MKKPFLFSLLFITLQTNAQDTSKAIVSKEPPHVNHEFGLNSTFLLKQILSLSNSNLTLLPYNITYKYIRNSIAYRAGLGVFLDNSTAESSTATTGTTVPTGPDPIAPTTFNSLTIDYRLGWEKRGSVSSKLLLSAGGDLVGSYGSSKAQSSSVFNNLPFSYQYSKTTEKISSLGFGAGPVMGLQFFFTKNLSVFTEATLYFIYKMQKETSENYRNVSGGSSFTPTTTTRTDKLKESSFIIRLPTTIYLSYKF